jgi:F-type H+-transporting ATPase subunit alpha
LFSSALYSTIVPEQEQASSVSATVDTATSLDRVVIAKGTIVSQFPGGLAAVRLNDDDDDDDDARSAPAALSPFPNAAVGPSSSSAAAAGAAKSIAASADLQGKLVIFPDGSQGCVVAHRPPVVFVYAEPPAGGRRPDGLVKVTKDTATVQVSPGRCEVDLAFDKALATKVPSTSSLNGANSNDGTMERAIFAPIPKISDIALINNPMLTGVTMIDALSPIGQGQNMLWIGHDVEDMRRYAMDFLKTQVRDGKGTKCVYASTSRDLSTVKRQLKAVGLDKVHVVAPTDSDDSSRDGASKSARAVMIAGAACAVGEMYALEKGMNAVVVVDTVDLHKQLWDATTRVLVDVYGVDSVVKGDREGGASSEMRAFYSSLIQRSGMYKESRGGGSVTLLLLTQVPRCDTNSDQVFDASAFDQAPEKVRERINLLVQRNVALTADTLRKIDIPIPTEGDRRLVLQHIDDLISMSDGQVWLDERREMAGQVPPMDPQRSVTRIGIGADTASRADAPALRRIADRLRLDLSQASSLDGADNTAATRRQAQRRDALFLAMHQPSGSGGRRLSESCVALLSAQEGYLDEAASSGTESGQKLVQELLDHVTRNAAAAMAEVDRTLDLSPGARGELTEAIRSFFQIE